MELLKYIANFTLNHIDNDALLEKAALVLNLIADHVLIEDWQLDYLSEISCKMLSSKDVDVKA